MDAKEKLNKTVKALFIKLGAGGGFEKECIEKNILKLGYNDMNHELCSAGRWSVVRKDIIKKYKVSDAVATFHLNQIKYFYEAGSDVLWITFHENKLYWCFSEPEIFLQGDGTKIRKAIGKWSCEDLNGKTLFLDNISGRLSKTQGFRATICSVPEKNYLIKKITGEQSEEIKEAEESFSQLKGKVISLIKKLNPKDFELLVDLIFRSGGWQREGVVGKVQKLIDLAIFHPITRERAVVQIKCGTNAGEFNKYKTAFDEMADDYDKFFYITHTPQGDLDKYEKYNDNPKLKLYSAEDIAALVINAGLFDWLVKKVG